jgi:hypothetical protein
MNAFEIRSEVKRKQEMVHTTVNNFLICVPASFVHEEHIRDAAADALQVLLFADCLVAKGDIERAKLALKRSDPVFARLCSLLVHIDALHQGAPWPTSRMSHPS